MLDRYAGILQLLGQDFKRYAFHSTFIVRSNPCYTVFIEDNGQSPVCIDDGVVVYQQGDIDSFLFRIVSSIDIRLPISMLGAVYFT